MALISLTTRFTLVKVSLATLALITVTSNARADITHIVKARAIQVEPQGGPPTVVKAGEFTQRLDQLSFTDSRTFKQRYWVTQTYTKGPNTPVFLYVCGESECGGSALMYGPLPKIARGLNGTIVALEHRYYGKSQPFADLTTPNLKYLSTAQALEDLRAFRNAMKSQRGFDGPWVLIGGSYAGNLAAYARRTYPLEFVGAVASSAPVEPALNFAAYDHFVAGLAGPECVADLQKTLGEIERITQTPDGYRQIQTLFAAKTVTQRDDFLYLLSDIASAALQLGYKTQFCTSLKTEGVEGYRKMKLLIEQKVADFSRYTAEEAIDPTLSKYASGWGMRQWFYQSCQEYGYWQNAWPDPKESARSREINASYHDRLCQRLFAMPKAQTTDLVHTRYFEPLLTSVTTNILFTRGTLDPWSALALSPRDQGSLGQGSFIKEIPGAYHCDDLGVGGSPAVVEAKAFMESAIRSWL